jgi:tRNA(fMet)-specific endonuclease VapC
MSTILLDTNVASFIFKDSDYATPYKPLLNGHELAISFMSIAELYQWAFMRQWGDRRIAQLEQYLLIARKTPVPCAWGCKRGR